ncbi:TPA: phosphoserine phosphatase, partial [Streptococcus pneumoniae]
SGGFTPIVGEISKIPWYCLFHCQPA